MDELGGFLLHVLKRALQMAAAMGDSGALGRIREQAHKCAEQFETKFFAAA